MARTYRVGIASLVHDHVWDELKHWRALPKIELIAASDSNAPLRERVRREHDLPRVYESWREMLAKETIDIVLAASENSTAVEIVEACAEKGIHVVSEKPMAANLAQAKRMLEAAAEAKTELVINWPIAWRPEIQEWERRIAAGEIGSVFHLSYRAAHNGPKEIGCSRYFYDWLYDAEKNGAGAFMDYCCYGANFCARFLGLPIQVTALRGTLIKDYPVPDDNAVILMKYPHALGLAEASWTQPVPVSGPNPVAYGTNGSLAVSGNAVVLQRPGREPAVLEPKPLETPRRSAPEYLIHCLETKQPVEGLCSAKVGRDAQEILEAGLRSSNSGCTQSLPLG